MWRVSRSLRLPRFRRPGLPGQVSYFTLDRADLDGDGGADCAAGMLIAVEPVPDMFRTVANVTMDVAVAGAVDRAGGENRNS